jgi:hypothetical protein
LEKLSPPLQDMAARGAESDRHAPTSGAARTPTPGDEDMIPTDSSLRQRRLAGRVAALAIAGAAATLGALSDADAGAAAKRVPGRHGESLAAPLQDRQALANEAFQARRYADAYGRFAALADEGDAASAWMALLLVSNGPQLFGSEWSATPGQLRRWTTLAMQQAGQQQARIPEHDRGE